ncbi:aminopeptidase N [bacterium]|nr:aminopeptidase N [bacterium]
MNPRDADNQVELKTKYLRDYAPPDYLVPAINLHFDIGDKTTCVTAELQIERAAQAKDNAPLRLDGKRLELQSVAIDGAALADDAYRVDDEALHVADVPAKFTLTTQVLIDPANNTALEGIFACGDMLASQCEAEGFRCITYFPDRPDVLSRYRVSIEADAKRYPVLLSNGNCLEKSETADGRHRVVWDDPHLKPCYLFALVAGDLLRVTDTHTTPSGREVSLELYAEHGQQDRLAFAMESLRQAMLWDERTYGREYDLDRYLVVAVSSFNMGAMENKGLNIFNSSLLLATPDIATDASHIMVRDVVAHEYFHNWTGNRITCRDWFQLSLKEGLTVLREQQFSEDMNDPAIARVEQVRHLRARQFPEDAGPNAHPVRPESYVEMNNFYTMTVYEKGAEVIRMMRGIVGADGFARGMDTYFDRHDGQAVTIEDFVRAIEDGSGVSVGAQFRRWYSQAGTPRLQVEQQFDGDTLTLSFSQTVPATPGQADKQPMPLPIAVRLLGAEAASAEVTGMRQQGEVLILDDAQGQVTYSGLHAEPVVSLLRGFSAPVRLQYAQTAESLATIMREDSDAFARWEACQRLIHQACEAHQAGQAAAVEHSLDVLAEVLKATDLDDAILPEWLSLPTPHELADSHDSTDVDAVLAMHDAVRSGLGKRLQAELPQWLARSKAGGAWQFTQAEVARRRLHAGALDLLAAADAHAGLAAAQDLLSGADNLSDRLAALQAVNDMAEPQREAMFAAFAEQWADEDLVMDHWFRLQAASAVAGTPAGVRDLQARDDFDLTRPNRVRAVLSGFASQNFAQFHAADGAGYAVMADAVTALDAINPQVAARMVVPITRFARLHGERSGLMREALERVLAQPKVSANVAELAKKALEAAA